MTNPNSTLTSSASTNIRRSLQSLPFPPSDDRLLGALLASCSNLDVISVSLNPNEKGWKEKEKRGHSAERRRKVDHWVGSSYLDTGWGDELLYEMWSKFWLASTETSLVVYVDDVFVRLSLDGLVLLFIYFIQSWSNFGFLSPDQFLLQTCFISNSTSKQDSSCSPSTKPARACDASYDTVNNESHKSDTTIPSLSHFPPRLSMPSLFVARQHHALDSRWYY